MSNTLSTKKLNLDLVEKSRKVIRAMSSNNRLKASCINFGISIDVFHAVVRQVPELSNDYEAARLMLADTLADEILDIADNEEDVGRAKNMIDARKWYAAALRPTRYGNKLDVTVQHNVDIRNTLEQARQRLNIIQVESTASDPIALPDTNELDELLGE